MLFSLLWLHASLIGGFLWSGLSLGLQDEPPAVGHQRQHKYIALYKPALTLCSLQEDGPRAQRKQRDRRGTLADLNLPEGLHVVGRLDRDSEGLLLLTDDGQFTSAVAEPSQENGEHEKGCCKTYWALVKGNPDESALDRMRRGGLTIRGAKTRPPIAVNVLFEETATLLPKPVLGMDRAGTWLEIILNEGRNRQIRRITADAGHPTIRLVRVTIGLLSLFDESSNIMLQPGEWRYIKKGEILPTIKA